MSSSAAAVTISHLAFLTFQDLHQSSSVPALIELAEKSCLDLGQLAEYMGRRQEEALPFPDDTFAAEQSKKDTVGREGSIQDVACIPAASSVADAHTVQGMHRKAYKAAPVAGTWMDAVPCYALG